MLYLFCCQFQIYYVILLLVFIFILKVYLYPKKRQNQHKSIYSLVYWIYNFYEFSQSISFGKNFPCVKKFVPAFILFFTLKIYMFSFLLLQINKFKKLPLSALYLPFQLKTQFKSSSSITYKTKLKFSVKFKMQQLLSQSRLLPKLHSSNLLL